MNTLLVRFLNALPAIMGFSIVAVFADRTWTTSQLVAVIVATAVVAAGRWPYWTHSAIWSAYESLSNLMHEYALSREREGKSLVDDKAWEEATNSLKRLDSLRRLLS